MKQLFFICLACLFLSSQTLAQSLSFEDSTFTAPVTITDFSDGVSFENCHFTGITADAALTLINVRNISISHCTFENITGNAILVSGPEGSTGFYMSADTLTHISGKGLVVLKAGLVNISTCHLSNIGDRAFDFSNVRRIEIARSQISEVGSGIHYSGGEQADTIHISTTNIVRVNGLPDAPESGDGIRVANAGFAWIERCMVDSCMAAGIVIGQGNSDSLAVDSVIIQQNTISHTHFDGLLGEGNVFYADINNNEISYTGLLGGHLAAGDHGIRWQGRNFHIADNQVHHSVDTACGGPACGAGISLGNAGLLINNRVYNCAGNGVEYTNGQPLSQQVLRIFNNIVYDVTGNPILIRGADTLTNDLHIIINNNTLLGILQGDTLQNAPLAVCCNASQITAQGNILLFQGVQDLSKFIGIYANAGLVESLNLRLTDTLGFVNYTGRDFHLIATSPARDFLPVGFGEPNEDFDHEPRDPQHDAGADEFPAASPDFCGCVNCPDFMPDNFMGTFFYYVSDAANDDLANPAQGVCSVQVNFDHQYLGDLTMQLFSPTGQSVQLVGPTGFFGPTDGDYWDVSFVPCNNPASPDAGFSAQWDNFQSWGMSSNYNGTYYPEQGCLEDFNTGPVSGIWRLVVTDGQAIDVGNLYDFKISFCDTAGLACLPCAGLPNASFLASTDGWNVSLQNNVLGAATYELDFGDGESFSGNMLPSFHTYADTGTYVLRLVVSNLCGTDSSEQTIYITGGLPTASISITPTSGCIPLPVHVNLLASNHVDQFIWVFPNATPQISYEPEPTVVYNTPGIQSAFLVISNAAGADTLYYPNFVTVFPDLVTPSFTVQVQSDSIIATNTTQGFTEYYWLLNDAPIVAGNAEQQIVQVDTPGIYSVTLYVANDCDTAIIVQSVPVIFTGIKSADNNVFALSLLPNPNDGHCRLELMAIENVPADIVILNTAGQRVFIEHTSLSSGKNAHDLDLSHLPSGFYLLRLQTAAGAKVISFILQK